VNYSLISLMRYQLEYRQRELGNASL